MCNNNYQTCKLFSFVLFLHCCLVEQLSESRCCGISQSNRIVKDQAGINSKCQAADLKEVSIISEELDSVAINGHLIWRELTGEPV